MKIYIDLVKKIIKDGKYKENRTGVKTKGIIGYMLQHDLSEGFPLLTTKKMAFNSIKVELEGFIKGITNKSWYKKRKCYIWNEWCNPKKIPSNLNDEKRKEYQIKENDLGKIYGYQWRKFNKNDSFKGIDQFKLLINKLKKNPYDRRLIVNAWNPLQLDEMSLPPCHILYQISYLDNKLHLTWYQRSCDVALGIPFNLASYSLLLHLISLETNIPCGTVTGMLNDVHIYEDHIEGLKQQIKKKPFDLPIIKTKNFTSIYKWNYENTRLVNYKSHEKIKFNVAV